MVGALYIRFVGVVVDIMGDRSSFSASSTSVGLDKHTFYTEKFTIRTYSRQLGDNLIGAVDRHDGADWLAIAFDLLLTT